MNTEEKARRYDEALEKMRKMFKTWSELAYNGKTFLQDLKHIFPELAESEDERIRKAIIELLKEVGRDDTGISENAKCMIAYLEKQKEPIDPFDTKLFQDGVKEGRRLEREDIEKEPIPIPDKFSGLKSLMLQYLRSAANRKDDTEIESDTDLWGRKILDYVWRYSEKQKEQKPVVTHGETYHVDTLGTQQVIAGKMPQKPAEWNEEDDWKRKELIQYIEEKGDYRTVWMTWLKSLPERFNLQPKEEWSEEDKHDFDDLIMRFGKSLKSNRCYFTSYDVDWLKLKFNGNSCK